MIKGTFLWASLVAQMVKNLSAMQETWVRSLGQEDPLEKGMPTHSSILAWRFHGQKSLASYSPWGHKDLFMPLPISVCMRAQSLHSCLNLCDAMDCSPPSSAVPGILQATILEWIAMSSSRGSSQSRDRCHLSCISCTGGRFFYYWAIKSATAFSSELMQEFSYYRSYTLNSKSVWRMQSNSVACFFLLLALGWG